MASKRLQYIIGAAQSMPGLQEVEDLFAGLAECVLEFLDGAKARFHEAFFEVVERGFRNARAFRKFLKREIRADAVIKESR